MTNVGGEAMNGGRLILFLVILNLVGYLGMVVANGLANVLPINDITTGDVSALYPNLFVPAGITFSIWGLIYLLLGIMVVYQLLPKVRQNAEKAYFITRVGPFFFISCLANTGWIFAWHYQQIALTLGLMAVILGCLIAIYLRLNTGRTEALPAEKYFVHLPFSVYMGWITIATIANVSALLVDINWGGCGLSEEFWAATVITVGIIIGLAVLFTRRDIYFNLVVLWAFAGILIQQVSIVAEPSQAVVITTITGLVIISLNSVYQLIRGEVY